MRGHRSHTLLGRHVAHYSGLYHVGRDRRGRYSPCSGASRAGSGRSSHRVVSHAGWQGFAGGVRYVRRYTCGGSHGRGYRGG